MSDLIVEVVRIEKILPHGNADALDVAVVKGWECIVKKGQFGEGDLCVYFPVDSILTRELAERIGVAQYLAPLKKGYLLPAEFQDTDFAGRIRAARLRGRVSFGVLIPAESGMAPGQSVKDFFRVVKYEPPERTEVEDAAPSHALFQTYTDIQNFRNFPDLFVENEEVVVTEKIHGTCSRTGLVRLESGELEFMVGSHKMRRKADPERKSLYSLPLTPNVEELLRQTLERRAAKSVILFAEIYGSGVQDMHYGLNTKTFRAFDISVDSSYLPYDEFAGLCKQFHVETVPLLYRGPYHGDLVRSLTGGMSVVCRGQIKEGIVIKPAVERNSDALLNHSGRLILKNISDDYYLRKEGTEYH
jgi:RNA ligase (TIGR02306 family)